MTDYRYRNNRRPVYEAALAAYGQEKQDKKLEEELAEFLVEHARRGTDRFDRAKYVSELADAFCVLEQKAMLFDETMEKDVVDHLAAKVARLKGRVEG